MCGIFGIVMKEERPLGDVLLSAARRLAYRGYDSVGCATIDAAGRIDLRKDSGRIDDVDARLHFGEMRGRRGITQLRWATFGSPARENAQPHLDSDGDLVGAHNGNIVNNVALREVFAAEGMTVRGTNDGESCVHAVERHVNRGLDMVVALRCAAEDLQGDYAFVIGRADDKDRTAGAPLYAIKQGSGLVVGIADGATCVSSDLPSILPITNRILRLEDGEMVTLWPDRAEIRRVEDGALVERDVEVFTGGMDFAEKGGYPHFMLKEIHEQPKVARDLLHWLEASPDVAPFLDELVRAERVYLVGCGTSYHACVMGAAYLNRLAKVPAVAALAPQFRETLLGTLSPGDTVVLVSQSGETKDVLSVLKAARPTGAKLIGVVNVVGSALMHGTDLSLPLVCGYEVSVPATKTFLNQVVLFLYLADQLRRGGRRIDWEGVPALMETTLRSTDAGARRVAEILKPLQELYFLGYGLTLGAALEGALKLKEVTYAHCEGILSAEFKHGPLSAVYPGYPVVFVAAPEDAAMMVSHVNEVTCRGGRAIAVAAEDRLLRENVHEYLLLPSAQPEVVALLATIPLQLASYYMGAARGIDPDFPRNLSKTVTVD